MGRKGASQTVLVASPDYVEAHGLPTSPNDVLSHRTLACRSQGTGQIIPWILNAAGDTLQIAAPAATVVHDLASQTNLAIRGLGIANLPVAMAASLIDGGELVRILPAWSSTLEAPYIYFPSQRHQSAALRAFIACLQGEPAHGSPDGRATA